MSRTVRIALVVCALAVASPIVASAAAQGEGGRVLVATTGNNSELRTAVPISRSSGKKPRVVMSLGPAGVPSLDGGDRLKVTSELEVTTDCHEKSARCVGRPYSYNPIVQVRLVLANGPGVIGGTGALELGTQRLKCRQKLPDREHHCVVVFTDAALDVAGASELPCGASSCHINVVVDAHNPRKPKGKKGRRNKLLIGEDEPDGSVNPDKGRVNAIRFAPGDQPEVAPEITNTLLIPSVPVRKQGRNVILSQELTGLERNDQLAVFAGFTTTIDNLSYNVLNRTRVILGSSPTATAPGKEVKELTEPKGEISEANGYNCTQRNPICPTSKVGVMTMRRDAENDAGDPIPLYANVVFDAVKPGAVAPAGDVIPILQGGGLSVTTYPADMKG
ncbi:MAG: hypothetical protein ACRDL3_00885 [Solirubrobacterales bacterium]